MANLYPSEINSLATQKAGQFVVPQRTSIKLTNYGMSTSLQQHGSQYPFVAATNNSSSGKCREVTTDERTTLCYNDVDMANQISIENSFVTGKIVHFILSSILTIGILMLILIPLGSTFLYIDYKQQLAQRKSNKNDLCKSKCSFGADCILDEYTHQPFCRCPLGCPDDYQPVCGSDANTYINLCHLNYESCSKQQALTVVLNNTCAKTNQNNQNIKNVRKLPKPVEPTSNGIDKCGNGTCHLYADCRAVHAKPSVQLPDQLTYQCHCPDNCSQQGAATICATNHQNYVNECEMRRDACLLQIELKVLHYGQCGHCHKECKFYSECKVNEQNIPECVCPQVCVRIDRPVCGDNGVTYENECELQVAACRLQTQINVKFNDSCDLCHNVICNYGSTCVHGQCICPNDCQNNADEPLCANDGNTYRNECELNRMACNSKMELIALFYGKCEETSENYIEDLTSLFQNTDLGTEMVPDTEPAAVSLVSAECYHLTQDTSCKFKSVSDNDYVYICDKQVFNSKCEMSLYSCNQSVVGKPDCHYYCHCNRFGLKVSTSSNDQLCNYSTGQCYCKDGIDGPKCDKCSHGFWDFQEVLGNPHSDGCKQCKCNKMGSVNQDCNKMNGKCKCKRGITGPKCERCPVNTHLTMRGCVRNAVRVETNIDSCLNHHCQLGAVCKQNQTSADCWCQFNCKVPHHSSTNVCASDGSIHRSMCHFHEYMCQTQKRLHARKHCTG